jgi:membrane peptidoglycan carboxypeptidase
VWVGDQRSGTKYPMHDVTINGTYYPEVFGRTFPGPIWKQIMESALKNVPPSQFPAIDPSVIHGVTVPVPDVTGLDPQVASTQLSGIGLAPVIAVKRVASAIPAGRVAYTDPRAGSSVSSGRTVTIYVSTGVPKPHKVKPKPPPDAPPSPSPTPTVGPSP